MNRETPAADNEHTHGDCPACDSKKWPMFGSAENQGETITLCGTCQDCGAKWTELYDLIGYVDLQDKDGEPVDHAETKDAPPPRDPDRDFLLDIMEDLLDGNQPGEAAQARLDAMIAARTVERCRKVHAALVARAHAAGKDPEQWANDIGPDAFELITAEECAAVDLDPEVFDQWQLDPDPDTAIADLMGANVLPEGPNA